MFHNLFDYSFLRFVTFLYKKQCNDEHLCTVFHKYASMIVTSALHSSEILIDKVVIHFLPKYSQFIVAEMLACSSYITFFLCILLLKFRGYTIFCSFVFLFQ